MIKPKCENCGHETINCKFCSFDCYDKWRKKNPEEAAQEDEDNYYENY